MKTALTDALRRVSAPLGWYYAIAVAVPVLNGAALDATFLEHVAFVFSVPLVLVAAAGCVLSLRVLRALRVSAVKDGGSSVRARRDS